MAESNATQVILTDDGLKIIKAQSTADNAVGNINDINSDNKLTPSEKLKLKQEYNKDVELYNIDIEQLKSVGLPTAELETAMSNLTDFVNPLLKEMNLTSTVDRNALNSVFTAFATADKNVSQAFVNMVQQVADDAKKTGEDAKEAGEKAQAAGEEAKTLANQAEADVTQAQADAATAQADATTAQNSAQQALDNITVVDSKVDKLSTSTTAQFKELTTGYQEVISTVNNMNIGGRNIVLDSSNMGSFRIWQADGNSKLSDDKKEITVTTSHGGINIENKNLSKYLPNKGDTIVISADVKGNSHLQFNYNDGNSFVGQGTSIAVTTDYKRYSATFEWNPVNIDKASFVIYATGTSEQYLTIKNVKIEIGNKATDWSPAPEDLASKTQITALNNLINQKVSNDQYQSDKTQTADLISQTVTNAVNNINVGGRNYLLATGTPFTKTIDASAGDIYDFNYWYSFGELDKAPFKTGMEVMWSFDWEVSNMTSYGQIEMYLETSPFTVNKVIGSVGPQDLHVSPSPTNTSGHVEVYVTLNENFLKNASKQFKHGVMKPFKGTLTFKNVQLVIGNKATDWSPAPEDLASKTDITASINNIHLGVKNADGSASTFNMNSNTILLDANKIILSGNTSIQDGTIGTAKIANAAINTAQIADGAINNAKIANASIDDAKINSLNGNKLVENSITANKINVDDLIANGINTKTLTSINLNTSTLTTPQLNLGLNGTFNEDFDYTQSTSIFLPKKNKGTLTFNHGVLQSRGNMQTYVNGQWGGMNDNYTFQAGIDNSQWTEVAPGYIKLDLFKQNDTDVAERTYVDPTGFYYTTNGNQAYTSYVGNIVSTPQVQTASVLTKYIGPSAGQSLIQIDNNGSHYGLQVGSYAGKEAVLSDYIYDFAFSASSNVYITSNGHLARTTSASKYKYNISNPDYEEALGDRLLNVHLASWNDKNAVDSYAHTLNTGEDTEKISIDKYHGLIAEQLRDAGLGMFVEYNEDGGIEGIQYDRAWIPLLAVVRRLNNKINEYEMRISKLEGKK
ncbi:hypothetical protein PS423_03250 [Pediococcus acidilactici]|uniref:hypothetical protein n=1 Tax=Pediococcus acidilactici TaxID=1254 RepID=UPI002F262889